MPELPEVETIVRELQSLVNGAIFQSIEVHERRSASGDSAELTIHLKNQPVKKLFRRGKYICFQLPDNAYLTVHLRMTGKLLKHLTENDKKYLRVTLVFEKTKIYFVDVRKFGRVVYWPANALLLPELGPEPLDAEVVFKALNIRNCSRHIKTVLLDQHVLAGIGNIYADESLFRAGIHPKQRLDKVRIKKLRALSVEIPKVLHRSIENKGTTISDYRTPDAGSGGHQAFLKVYGREGQPCYTCGTSIQRIKINARSSHFCPKCQR